MLENSHVQQNFDDSEITEKNDDKFKKKFIYNDS